MGFKVMSRFAIGIIVLAVFFTLFPASVSAYTIRTSEQITVPVSETINDNFFAAGQTLLIDGAVTGDVVCAAQTVTIRGRVDGDILCAAQSIIIAGNVSGSVRTLSQSLFIESIVGRNITSAGQTISLNKKSVVAGGVAVATQTLLVEGTVGGKLQAAAQDATIRGTIGNDVYIQTEELRIDREAAVDGNLTYLSEQALLGGEDRVIGTVEHKVPQKPARSRSSENTMVGLLFAWIFAVIWQMVIIILIIRYAWKKVDSVQARMAASRMRTVLTGFAIYLLTPGIIILLFITVAGIPLGLMTAGLSLFGVFFVRVLLSLIVGNTLVKRFAPDYRSRPYAIGLIGTSISWLLFHLPIIGPLFAVGAMIYAMGGMPVLLSALFTDRTHSKSPSASPKKSSTSKKHLA